MTEHSISDLDPDSRKTSELTDALLEVVEEADEHPVVTVRALAWALCLYLGDLPPEAGTAAMRGVVKAIPPLVRARQRPQ
jgi:hypothetical protein